MRNRFLYVLYMTFIMFPIMTVFVCSFLLLPLTLALYFIVNLFYWILFNKNIDIISPLGRIATLINIPCCKLGFHEYNNFFGSECVYCKKRKP